MKATIEPDCFGERNNDQARLGQWMSAVALEMVLSSNHKMARLDHSHLMSIASLRHLF